MKDDDALLDKVVGRLRSEPTPEMPTVLTAQSTAKPRGWIWYSAAASALAASVVTILLWRSHTLPTQDPQLSDVVRQLPGDTQNSDVVVLAVDLAAPLRQLEANLDVVDAEIAALQSKAALLDARRMADELLVQN